MGRRRFRHCDLDVPVACIECAAVHDGEGRLTSAARGAGGTQIIVGKCTLRILVEVVEPAVGRRGVPVKVDFLDVLPMIAFLAVQSEGAFLEDLVLAVPHAKRKTKVLHAITDAAHAIFIPAIGPAACMVMR